MKDVKGKVAVVTGGAQGIGRALAERFGAEGMKVVIADVIGDALERTAEELRGTGLDVTGVVTDVTSLASVEALRDATLDAYGGVHVLCNNAGVGSGAEGHLWEHHLNDWRWSIDVNVLGVVHGINAFVPTMLARGPRRREEQRRAHLGVEDPGRARHRDLARRRQPTRALRPTRRARARGP